MLHLMKLNAKDLPSALITSINPFLPDPYRSVSNLKNRFNMKLDLTE